MSLVNLFNNPRSQVPTQNTNHFQQIQNLQKGINQGVDGTKSPLPPTFFQTMAQNSPLTYNNFISGLAPHPFNLSQFGMTNFPNMQSNISSYINMANNHYGWLGQQLGRVPTNPEMAAAMHLGPQGALQAIQSNNNQLSRFAGWF